MYNVIKESILFARVTWIRVLFETTIIFYYIFASNKVKISNHHFMDIIGIISTWRIIRKNHQNLQQFHLKMNKMSFLLKFIGS